MHLEKYHIYIYIYPGSQTAIFRRSVSITSIFVTPLPPESIHANTRFALIKLAEIIELPSSSALDTSQNQPHQIVSIKIPGGSLETDPFYISSPPACTQSGVSIPIDQFIW